jgi:acyl-CoA synthetase (AMP-forming)/AMP-acid ligase II
MIVTGGENVYSGEVETVIYKHLAVQEAAVFGIPDPKWGEVVTACVVLKPGEALRADDLIAHCRRSLASYKVPRRVPKSGSGKILKRILREHFLCGSRTRGGLTNAASLLQPRLYVNFRCQCSMYGTPLRNVE